MKLINDKIAGLAMGRQAVQQHILGLGLLLLVCLWAIGCKQSVPVNRSDAPAASAKDGSTKDPNLPAARPNPYAGIIVVDRDVKMKDYFPYMDSLVLCYDSTLGYALTEHLLVRANAWIIDTLASYDYDLRMLKGEFIEDQKEIVVLHRLDTLWLPNDSAAAFYLDQMENTLIDVNIPEFKLRIIEYGLVKYTFSVRVGRREHKYLSVAGRSMSLLTPIGEGEVVRLERDPTFVNPVNGRQYYATHRDDGKLTKLPQIPFIEPSINGLRPGSLIHPTTNPHTLGKAYSNGCVGARESAAWIIYYHAPLGTKVRFRYNLLVLNAAGDTLQLKDVYRIKKGEPQLVSNAGDTCSKAIPGL